MTDQKPKLIRRWFQFSLRTLLIAVTLVAGLLLAWRAFVEPYRRQRETMKLVEELGGSYTTEPGGPTWLRGLFGDDNFQNIIEIYLFGHGVSDADLADLARLKGLLHLRTLTLESTGVTDAGLASLSHFYQLEELDVRGFPYEITDAGMGHICQLKSLRGLHLDDTIITNVGLKRLASLTSLEGLHIGNTRITDEGLVHLQDFCNLRVLNLEETEITDEGLVYLQPLENLEILYLNMTSISDAGLTHLKTISSLTYLELHGTLVTDTNVEKLQQSLPQCKIITRYNLNEVVPLYRPLR